MTSPLPAPPCFVLINIDGGDAVAKVLPLIRDALAESCGPGSAFAHSNGDFGAEFRVATSVTDRSSGEIAINIRQSLPEAPDAAAYHYDNAGVPDIEVGVSEFEGLIDGNDAVSAGIDHEVKETLGDLGANGWKDNGQGKVDAEEYCDKVQNTGYAASNGVMLSNFLFPSAFIPGASGPWDYLGVMQSQDDVSNGYGIQADSPANVGQIGGQRVMGEHVTGGRRVHAVGSLTEKQLRRKAHPWSRAYRRGLRLAKPSPAQSATIPPPPPAPAAP
ncbi:MAG TPA: hypothetical protein VE987_12910 [Polyangiaceae bacterium]|nr:hypothetical protein [Polyangiaceae bacterium]